VSKYYVQVGWNDAVHLSEEDKADLIKSIPPWQRDARTKGLPYLGKGRVFKIAEEELTVKDFEIPEFWPRGYALDVGWNRTAALFAAHDRESDILYLYSEHYGAEQPPQVHAQAVKARGSWMPGLIDPAARGRSQADGKRLMTTYQKLGLNLQLADNEVDAGLTEVWVRMVSGRLKVMASLQNFFAEMRMYRRNDKEKIVKAHDHLMDCCRYLCLKPLGWMKTPPVKTEKYSEESVGGRLGWMS
jgi:hypothetical protein